MNNKINPLSTGILGAIVGATAVSLSYKPIRKKMKAKLNEFLEKSDEKMEEVEDKVKKNVSKVTKSAKNKLADGLNKAEDKLTALPNVRNRG